MLIQNVHLDNQNETSDVRVTDGKFAAIAPHAGEEVIDGHGNLMLPPFVDSHVHLDSTLTAGQPEWNESGTLFDGIRIWGERKQTLTKQDVKDRATLSIRKMLTHGI
ncbi:MAG: amidohydrolase family protein, partial [Limosilactobacillus sp.]|nr:amidohydrolase family protein [Limosilactobacillus sp.]